METGAQDHALLKISNLKGFVTVLQTIKPVNSKQLCSVDIANEGFRIKWEDDSRTLQSSLFVGQQLFAEYACPWVRKQIGIPFGLFLDTLLVFQSTLSQSDVLIKYPGLQDELILELHEEQCEQSTICMFSKIDCREIPDSQDLTDHWHDPSSFFLAPGGLLKEAIEDLEASAGNGSMTLTLTRMPPTICFAAHGGCECEVKLEASRLPGFQCRLPLVEHSYKYKHVRAMLINLPQAKDATAQASTKVTIDGNGLLKMTHMMSLQGVRALGGAFNSPGAFAESQRAANANAGVVQFTCTSDDMHAA